MQLPFHTLDVFTDRRFGGPLAVVHDRRLSGEALQAIARSSTSRTVFVLKPENPAHSARIRIFTPARELSFAGHPTIGAAVPWRSCARRRPTASATPSSRSRRASARCGSACGCRRAAFAEIRRAQAAGGGGRHAAVERLAAALGLIPSEIGFENHRPTRFSAGNTFAFVPIASLEAMARARANAPYWAAAFGGMGAIGAFLYTRQCVHNTAAFHARMFAPGGVPEARDGVRRGEPPAWCITSTISPTASTSAASSRATRWGSLIYLTLVVEGGRLGSVRIGGHAVRVAEGRLTV